MNLVLSGPIDDSLRNLVVALTRPRRVVRLHARADRLEGAIDDEAVRTQIADLCDAARVDHAYIEEGLTFADFKLLAMDMDSTLITIECIDELADYAGKKAEVAAITEAAMRGEIDFEESLRRRVSALKGLDAKALNRVYNDRLRIEGGASETIRLAKEAGLYTILVSGGFDYFTKRLGLELDFNFTEANHLEIEDGHLNGRLLGPIIDAEAKASLVSLKLKILKCSKKDAIVIGDGANDICMMDCVEMSIAYHAKPSVQAAANYRIDFGNFTVLNDWLQFPDTGTTLAKIKDCW